ncbi:zf-UBP-domain-containing protein [Exidia glandulosa HHB12029]|uniref:Zf-UBP-domain-containing protein n=1 Tax=Exidia glandulosa HHB12029 TaxID=1314781 RepID=A0A166AYX1_EXIGL|nr:zf-UBP-domain-containing protein [Exidia glandulosa HHB12029]
MASVTATTKASGKEKATNPFGTATASFVARSGSTISVESGSTNLPEGIIHIFKANAPPARPDESPTTSKRPLPPAGATFDGGDGTILAVLAVPSWMNHSDFLTFVAPAAEGMAHVRIIRDFAPNRSIVLMKFRNQGDAQEFVEEFNGKPFNSMEPEACQVVRVASVQVDSHDVGTEDFLRTVSASDSYELPTCPVCLDRMDSAVTGLVTIPCSHTFHCTCLSKWGDSRCPVCRYSQNLLSSSKSPQPQQGAANTMSACFDCSTTTNLWICLICGNVGCGRYGRGHAQAHFNLTTHLYALELETQRVWDYASDGYVHRLIQNRADGKVVELPSAASLAGVGQGGPGPADAHAADKIEAIGLEYSYLLTSQLDSQRAYYEEQANELRHELRDAHLRAEAMAREYEERRRADEERRKEEEEHLREYERDKARAEKKAERLADLARKLEHDLKEERAVSEGLMRNVAAMKAKTEAADAERADLNNRVNDLQDQLRDVMFFLEARTKIEDEGDAAAEAAGGSVVVPPPSQGKKKRGKK